ncbi:hypothetical protein AB1N83_009727 [Pleurotus pulmonarius]
MGQAQGRSTGTPMGIPTAPVQRCKNSFIPKLKPHPGMYTQNPPIRRLAAVPEPALPESPSLAETRPHDTGLRDGKSSFNVPPTRPLLLRARFSAAPLDCEAMNLLQSRALRHTRVSRQALLDNQLGIRRQGSHLPTFPTIHAYIIPPYAVSSSLTSRDRLECLDRLDM